jgi:hypothetical protein
MDLAGLYAAAEAHGPLPPVERWNPPDCGDIDMVIRADGTWVHEGRPIARPALVRLFSTILRRDGERYVLVTPAEKVGITVEDVPFLAVEMTIGHDALAFRTNVGDRVTANQGHPLRFDLRDGFRPYILVRSGLEARLNRAVAQELADLAEPHEHGLGVSSGGVWFALPPL